MIEINLIKKKKPFKLPLILGMDFNQISVKGWIFVIILSYSADWYFIPYADSLVSETEQKVQDLKNQKQKLEEKLKGDGGIRKKLAAFNKQVEFLKQRQQKVDDIIKERTNPRDLLEKIARVIPEDMWVDSLVISEDRSIELKGAAESYKSIGSFLNQCNELPFFNKGLALVTTKTEEEKRLGTVKRIERYEIKGEVTKFDMWRD